MNTSGNSFSNSATIPSTQTFFDRRYKPLLKLVDTRTLLLYTEPQITKKKKHHKGNIQLRLSEKTEVRSLQFGWSQLRVLSPMLNTSEHAPNTGSETLGPPPFGTRFSMEGIIGCYNDSVCGSLRSWILGEN